MTDEPLLTRESYQSYIITKDGNQVSISRFDRIKAMPNLFAEIDRLFPALKGAHGELAGKRGARPGVDYAE